MPEYDVHMYAVVRVKVKGVKAETAEEAINTAMHDTDLCTLFAHREFAGGVIETEYADEINLYLVDAEGDPEYKRSAYYEQDKEGKFVRSGEK